MPALPDPPLAQRSWLGRGQFSPSPKWGLTGHAIMYETQLTFSRRGPAKDLHGGFKGTAKDDYYVAMGHVEVEERVGASTVFGGVTGIALGRRYWAQIDLPVDTADLPRKGDRMRFIDQYGATVDIAISVVDTPEGSRDHVEIVSEDIT